MKNFARIGLSMFVVIAVILMGCGEVHAKGAVHGTLTVHGGVPNTFYQINVIVWHYTIADGTTFLPIVGQYKHTIRFDENGTGELHFAIAAFGRYDVTSLTLQVAIEISADPHVYRMGGVETEDVDGDGIIGARDIQVLEVLLQ